MTRKVPGSKTRKGSQKWLQVLVNEKVDIIDAEIGACLADRSEIQWLSPLNEDDFAEYTDKDFIDRLDIELEERPLDGFWPNRGPNWDGLAKTVGGEILLIEAKSHIREMDSDMAATSPKSVELITASLNETRSFIAGDSQVDWRSGYYQYANRLAHLYLLRTLNHLSAHLLFVNFINDEEMSGPQSISEWEAAVEDVKSHLGIGKEYPLSEYVHHIYIDVNKLRS